VKCAGCCRAISPRELVRRAPDDVVYHVDCFACVVCGRQLGTGDPLYVLPDGRFVCRDDCERGAAPGAVVEPQPDGRTSTSVTYRCVGVKKSVGFYSSVPWWVSDCPSAVTK